MKPTKLIAVFAALAIACLALASAAGAASQAGTPVTAKLTAKAEVPAPKGGASGTGAFTATLKGSKLTWKLTWSKLTGPANAAHIHLGKPGKAGNVVVPLCAAATCKSGVHGTATLKPAVLKALKAGGTYVNVHTAKNPAGEIRGQVAFM
jgi:Cu/Zn superoxide dismutase